MMLQAQVPKLQEICRESLSPSLSHGSILKFCNSIILAHIKSAFGGKEALWDLLTDKVDNMNKSAQVHRWKKGSRLTVKGLLQSGGKCVIDCLANTMIGSSLVNYSTKRHEGDV